jgi:hypothetical protein
MNRGFVKLWRKSIESGWLANHKLWAFWSYCLLKATYRSCSVIVGCQQVQLEPGQFVYGRKKAAQETGLSEQELRTCIAFLKKAGNLTIKSTNKFSVITIANWGCYQSEPDEATNRSTNEQPTTNHIQEVKKNKEEKKGLSVLLEKYAEEERTLIDQTLQAIAATRKTGKTTDSVKASILQQFEKFDRQQVLTGCRTYLEKQYYLDKSKDENYLYGIIRNKTVKPATPDFVPTNSKIFNDYYRNQRREV